MGGDARLSDHMHRLRTHLKLDVQTRGAHQGGVQRLISVQLGNRDMVFESTRHRFIELVQNAQGGVAICHLRQDQAKAVNVRDLGKAQVLGIHLFINGIERFFTA